MLKDILASERYIALNDIAGCWNGRYWIATAILAMAQVEGILWDFAKYLNKKRFRIYRSRPRYRRIAYEWDFGRKSYKHLKTSKLPEAKCLVLNSVQALLKHTRLGELIEPEVYSYLMYEYYFDRCIYAHGKVSKRDAQADASVALLCLHRTLTEIQIKK